MSDFSGSRDLGFAIVGKTGTPDTTELASRLERYAGYEVRYEADVTLARLESIPSLVQLHGPITVKNYTYPKLYRQFRRFYSQRELECGILIEDKGLSWAIERFREEDGYHGLRRVRQVLSIAPPDQLEYIIKDLVSPIFFKRYPEGRIWYVSKHNRLEKLAAVVRMSGSLTPYGFARALEEWNDVPDTLREAHGSGPSSSTDSLTILLSLFYPYIYGLVVSRIDSYFILQLDKPLLYEPCYPTDLFDLVRPSGLYREARVRSIANLGEMALTDEKLIHRRYVHKQVWTPHEFESLLRWWVNAEGRLLSTLLDICKYVDPNGYVEPVRAFQSGLTWHRILHLVAVILTERDPFMRKLIFFQILDQFGSLLADKRKGVKDTDVFHYLLHTSFHTEHLEPRLDTVPPPFGEYLSNLARQLRKDIIAQTLAGIWAKSRVGNDTVTLSYLDADTQQIVDENQSIEEYVPGLLRVFRNTIHGYNLKSRQFEKYLLFHDGTIPDYLPDLAPLYVIAILVDPSSLANQDWK